MKKKNGNTRETASAVYAELFRKLYASDEPLFVNFLNKLFNHSNWTVTELEASMRDVQPSPPHTTPHLTTTHLTFLLHTLKKLTAVLSGSRNPTQEDAQLQFRCLRLFQISVDLLRMSEVIALELPDIFLNQELNITRLAEFLLYVINRSTVGHSANIFQAFLSLDIGSLGLAHISRVAILSPTVGILLNLYSALKREMNSKKGGDGGGGGEKEGRKHNSNNNNGLAYSPDLVTDQLGEEDDGVRGGTLDGIPSPTNKGKEKSLFNEVEKKSDATKVDQSPARNKDGSLAHSERDAASLQGYKHDIIDALITNEQLELEPFEYLLTLPWEQGHFLTHSPPPHQQQTTTTNNKSLILNLFRSRDFNRDSKEGANRVR